VRRTLLVLATVAVLVASLGVFLTLHRFGNRLPSTIPIPVSRACQASTEAGSVNLNADQMANAATIAAVGLTRGLPDRAVVVALATALQESKLVNLTGGDRDSVGLFQQRPSQGWGTAEQIRDPRYAASAFYSQLVRVRGWQEMRITEAAQAVQRSAFPEAYDAWSDDAQVLGDALVGETAGAVTCTRIGDPTLRGAAATQALGAGMRADWGDHVGTVSDAGLVVTTDANRAGWQYAHWLVAHSAVQNVARVRYADQMWTADSGKWNRVDSGPTDVNRVVAEVYPA
jgi:hypothetical protein